MSRPRRPFGSTRPGQLLATRIKVLAAELSDPERLRRGRTYASNGSVVDIAVDVGVATGTVLGSRSDPYLVELTVEPGDGPPARTELAAHCTCPDADLQFDSWCKHALATLLVVGDEIAIEPEVLDRWRGHPTAGDDADTNTTSHGDVNDRPAASGDPADAAIPGHRQPSGRRGTHLATVADRGDTFEDQLAVPEGAAMPLIPDIPPMKRAIVNDGILDRLIADALATLTGNDVR